MVPDPAEVQDKLPEPSVLSIWFAEPSAVGKVNAFANVICPPALTRSFSFPSLSLTDKAVTLLSSPALINTP